LENPSLIGFFNGITILLSFSSDFHHFHDANLEKISYI